MLTQFQALLKYKHRQSFLTTEQEYYEQLAVPCTRAVGRIELRLLGNYSYESINIFKYITDQVSVTSVRLTFSQNVFNNSIIKTLVFWVFPARMQSFFTMYWCCYLSYPYCHRPCSSLLAVQFITCL